MDIERIFCKVDDFCKAYENEIKKSRLEVKGCRFRRSQLSLSEMMTIILMFHGSCYRHFKGYYAYHVSTHLRSLFPKLLSYNRFVQLMPSVLAALATFLKTVMGEVSGISFVDSTSISICHNKRITRNRVFKGLARRGKTTMGWFFGFKLHLVVNDKGEILSFAITQANVDDRKPVPYLAKDLFGKLFGDRGYISQSLFEDLFSKGLHLITTLKSNMKNKFMALQDRLLLRKRFIIETINDQLKNISQIEHSRHRSPINFLLNLLAGLAAYQLQPKKPSLNFQPIPTFYHS